MKLRVVVLGGGFGGLELSTILSETIGDRIELTLIDRNDSFYFGFSKFDVMFGHKSSEAVRPSFPAGFSIMPRLVFFHQPHSYKTIIK